MPLPLEVEAAPLVTPGYGDSQLEAGHAPPPRSSKHQWQSVPPALANTKRVICFVWLTGPGSGAYITE